MGTHYPSRRTREEEGQKLVIALLTTALTSSRHTIATIKDAAPAASQFLKPVSKSSGMEMGMREGEG